MILGNHDDYFLQVLGSDNPDKRTVAHWIRNGGDATVFNYDYEGDLTMARVGVKIDYQHHISLFQGATLIEIDGPFAFVHAEIHPDRSIDQQERNDCLTIRNPFLDYSQPLSHVVVHGHTITDTRRPLVTHNRIALDTGAYGTGHLTALIIDPVSDSLEFAWTMQSDSKITVEFRARRHERCGTSPKLLQHNLYDAIGALCDDHGRRRAILTVIACLIRARDRRGGLVDCC